MIELGVNKLTKRYSSEPVLTEISFTLKTGDIIGMVGSNGCGKTTIFNIISGKDAADSGDISIRKDKRIGYLQQEAESYKEITVKDVILLAFKELLEQKKCLDELEKEMENLQDSELETAMDKYGKMQNEFENKGGYKIDSEVSKVCSGLKITQQRQKFDKLSGGEKTRVMLARILLEKPDILLLDEPTNHLDIEASEWLEEYLNDYEGAALIISHDRYFLDKTVSKILEIESGKSTEYTGNYSEYVKEKEKILLAEFEEFKNIRKKIKAMKAAAERYRIWGRINPDNSAHFARAKKLEEKIEELQQIEKPKEKFRIKMSFDNSSRSGNDVVIVEKISKSFSGKTLLKNADFLLRYKERLAFIGKNGSGKTTFIKMILGLVSPDSGTAAIGSSVNSGILEQEIEFPEPEKNVLEYFLESYPMYEADARNILARFLFRRDDVFKKLDSLSGGEKVRLKICFLMQQDINFLMLDEPTNHLDIESKEMIEEALLNFNGTIFFISHDRYFINKIATSIVALENYQLKRYLGNYDYYRSKSQKPVLENTIRKKVSSKKVKKVNPLIINKLEEDITLLEDSITEIKSQMEIHCFDYNKLMELQKILAENSNKLNSLMERWEKMQD